MHRLIYPKILKNIATFENFITLSTFIKNSFYTHAHALRPLQNR